PHRRRYFHYSGNPPTLAIGKMKLPAYFGSVPFFKKMQIQVFGIRHHGPGSASALLKALEAFMPDCILVEAPQDAEKLPGYLRESGFEPPVAMLIYNPATLSEAAYVPFAGFSPEWQAMQF